MARKRKADSDSDSYTEDEPVKKKLKVPKVAATSKKSKAPAAPTAQKASKQAPKSKARPKRAKRPPPLKLDVSSRKGSDGEDGPGGDNSAPAISNPSNSDDVPLPISAGRYPFRSLPPLQQEFLNTIRAFQPAGTPRDRPAGFKNPKNHNRCYQNAALTAILHSRRFVAYIQGWHMPRQNSPTFSQDTSQVLSGLDRLATALYDRSHDQNQLEVEADNFRMNVTFNNQWAKRITITDWMTISQAESQYSQCDASEFLTWLLQLIDWQLQSAGLLMEVPFNHLESIRLDERNSCMKCVWPLRLRRAPQVDISRSLALAPPGLNMDPTSKEYVAALQNRAPISMARIMSYNLNYPRDSSYKCPRCSRTGVMVDGKLQNAPEVLILYIRRYAIIDIKKKDKEGNKIMVGTKWFGQVPLEEEIDIAPWLEPHNFGEGTSIKYKLAAAVAHSGKDLNAGHYISYVRGSTDSKQWYEIDDNVVKPVPFSQFADSETWTKKDTNWRVRNTPYIMVYEKEFQKEIITAGRQPMNNLPSTPPDVKPAYWIDEYNADHPNQQLSAQSGGSNNTAAQDPTTAGSNAKDGSKPPPKSVDEDTSPKAGGKKASTTDPADRGQAADAGKADPTADTQPKDPPTPDQPDEEQTDSATKSQPTQKDQLGGGNTSDNEDGGDQIVTKATVDFALQGPSEDQGKGSAQLDIRITFGDFAVDLPSFTISQFDMNAERDVKVDAKITVYQAPSAAQDDNSKLVLDITEFMLDKGKGETGVKWNSRWKSSGAVTKQEPEKKEKKSEVAKKQPAKPKKNQAEPTRRQPGRSAKGGN